ncbi:hypothetical protein QQZ08_009496 [Neonectria magnoliae]|uniref:Uncharacterized protein n=1 Tax=Neonectria magnoliae TaxID=2732573 RepID=A0ABR1HN97_9HYPO
MELFEASPTIESDDGTVTPTSALWLMGSHIRQRLKEEWANLHRYCQWSLQRKYMEEAGFVDIREWDSKELWKHFREAHHAYLSIRLRKRDDFLANIDPETRTRVDHEIKRIQQTRARSSDDDNKKVLMQRLGDCRLVWKKEVVVRMSEYKFEIEKSKPPETEDTIECDRRKQKYHHDREVLERVSKAISSGTWIEQEQTNESLPNTKVEDLYDLKAGVIYHKPTNPGSDWLGHTVNCPLLGESRFPNQKIMVNDILNAPRKIL